MRIWARVTLLFSIIQLIVIIGVTLSVAFVVRTTVTDMVEQESRSMIGTISDTVEIFAGFTGQESFDRQEFAALRNFILKRSIGETGFYFVLNSSGDYIVHPNE